jgi:hypothetical protein
MKRTEKGKLEMALGTYFKEYIRFILVVVLERKISIRHLRGSLKNAPEFFQPNRGQTSLFYLTGFFLTCDDRLIKQAKQLRLEIVVMNLIDYIRQEAI